MRKSLFAQREIGAFIVLSFASGLAFGQTESTKSAEAQSRGPSRGSVMFSAADAQGNLLHSVTNQQVTIYENNKPVESLEVKDASELPLHLGIVLLASSKKFGEEQAAAIELGQKLLRPGKDEAFVISAGGQKPWSNTHLNWIDSAAFAQAVNGLDKNTGFPDLFNYQLETDSAGLSRHSLQKWNTAGGFSVFDVVWAMMKSDPRPARRAVVIFRDASSHGPGFGRTSTQASDDNHNQVIAMAQSLGVSFFAIGIDDPRPLVGNSRSELSNTYGSIHAGDDTGTRNYDDSMAHERELQYGAGRRNVERIAEETGGQCWWSTKKNYPDAISGILSDLSARWVASFTLIPGNDPNALHPLKVQVTGATRVLAPRAYAAQVQRKSN